MPLISDASNIFLGSTPVNAVYARNKKVWPTGGIMGPTWKFNELAGQPIIQHPDPNQTFPAAGWNAQWIGDEIAITIPPAELFVFDKVATSTYLLPDVMIPPIANTPIPIDATGNYLRWEVSFDNPDIVVGNEFFWLWFYWTDILGQDDQTGAAGWIFCENNYGIWEPGGPLIIPTLVFSEYTSTGNPGIIHEGQYVIEIYSSVPDTNPTIGTTLRIKTAECEYGHGSPPVAIKDNVKRPNIQQLRRLKERLK